MNIITHAPMPLKLSGAVLALALIAAVAVAVILTGGNPIQAQSTDNTYDPARCGPGFDDFYDRPEFPVDQVDSGHFALFDAYYDFDADEPHRPTQEREAWAGLMSMNFCPPELAVTDDGFGNFTTTRSQADIDIDHTVFHVDQLHTLTAADVAAYPFFKKGDADGDGVDDAVGEQVYWLGSGEEEDDSGLRISFSTALFDAKYWYREDDEGNSIAPLWYEVEAERELGVHPRLFGHIYVFDDSSAPAGELKQAVWNSELSDTGRFYMRPGQYRNFQWAFTKAGTYELEVHLNGHTRRGRLPDLPEDEVWHPVSEHNIVTSDVKRYIFQVGPLTLNEQPMFRAPDRTIPENSAAGTLVGSPVPVRQADSDPLTYELTGHGHGNFEVESVAQGAQIKVATGAHLDYESVQAYDLVMHVRDDKNRESGPDTEVDSSIAVQIALSDVDDGNPPSVSLSVDPSTQSHTGSVTFTGTVADLPHAASNLHYTLWVLGDTGHRHSVAGSSSTSTVTLEGPREASTISYQMQLTYGVPHHYYINVYSNAVQVVWE